MADVKISGLPASTTPLDGTEILPIVQGGVTKQVANNDLRPKQIQSNATSGVIQITGPASASTRVMTTPDANFTAARIDAAQSFTGDQTLATGNLVIGTSGKGIDFSATPGTGTSELFADYEEGTFTPIVFGTTVNGTGTYTFQVGLYVKIGKVVNYQISLAWTAHTGTGNFGGVSGLPFASVSTANNYATPTIYTSDLALSASNTIQGFIGPSTSTIALRQVPVGGGTASVFPFDTSVSFFFLTGSYITA